MSETTVRTILRLVAVGMLLFGVGTFIQVVLASTAVEQSLGNGNLMGGRMLAYMVATPLVWAILGGVLFALSGRLARKIVT